jgi:hypothetical protein
MGYNESSEGLISVRAIASPNNQVAKSVKKVSARNLQMLSNIVPLYFVHDFSSLNQAVSNSLTLREASYREATPFLDAVGYTL